ncbi:MAG TPA: signal peptidase I, partial [Candidatus Bathyarchaeia archaeon]|nr:signal peptidase I [Candidatus Bathyarchaeia archaeon]
MRKNNLRQVASRIPLFLIILLVPPLMLGTRTYPLIIVDGNSMNPVLLNGDVLVYRGIGDPAHIANGTVIAFMQSATGVPALDYLVMPIVVHRVIGEVVQSDGTVYYRTKGDNNKFDDPGLVKSNQVLGTPVTDVPLAGLFIEFVKSPQGLVFVIGAAVFFYMAKYDRERMKEKNKKELMAILARMSLNGEISLKQLEEFKLAIEFGEELPAQWLKNPVHAALAEWMKSGGLTNDWKEEPAKCPRCLQAATMIRGTKDYFLLCPRCSNQETETPMLPALQGDSMPDPFVKHIPNDGESRGAMALV